MTDAVLTADHLESLRRVESLRREGLPPTSCHADQHPCSDSSRAATGRRTTIVDCQGVTTPHDRVRRIGVLR